MDIAASTMVNITPAMGFFFGFALLAETAGVASPLIIMIAAIAVALLGNTLTQSSRSQPSAGSFVTYIGKAFGPVMAITTAVVLSAGYVIAACSIVVISGGWTQIIIRKYLHVDIPQQILTSVFVVGASYLMILGVKTSTRWAGTFFAFDELLLLVVVSIALLVEHAQSISFAPFEPSDLAAGFTKFDLSFPLAICLFIGWESSTSLAEETNDPRRNVGRAVFFSIAVMSILYLLLVYATVVSFDLNVKKLASSSVPFVAAAQSVLGVFALLAYLAGFTSTLGSLISAANSQARIIFSSGREGLLPQWAGKISERYHTPWASFVIYLDIVYVLGWNIGPVEFFGEIATLGAILVSLTYLVANVVLPFYYRRYHRGQFGPVKHLILPILGVLAIAYPLTQLVKPGQPSPFNYFPWIALAIIVVALAYALILDSRARTLGEREGSIVPKTPPQKIDPTPGILFYCNPLDLPVTPTRGSQARTGRDGWDLRCSDSPRWRVFGLMRPPLARGFLNAWARKRGRCVYWTASGCVKRGWKRDMMNEDRSSGTRCKCVIGWNTLSVMNSESLIGW